MKYALTFALIAPFTALPAFAQTHVAPSSDRAGTGYFGASVAVSSEYLGSDDDEIQVLPYLSLENAKGFDIFGTQLSYRLFEAGTGEGLGKWSLRAGPSVSWQEGRDSDDSPTLTGLEDVDGSIPIGGYVRSTIGPIGLRFDAGQDIAGGHDGLRASASIGTFLPLGNVFIRPTLSANWGDSSHNESFFGVSPAQAAASALSTYDAGAGIYSYTACLLYTSPSPRDATLSRMPSSA